MKLEKMEKVPLIETVDVERYYGSGSGRFRALGPVSLQVREGESLAVIGQSGSGKSTLLHLLAALDRPTSGGVRFRGTDIDEMSAVQADRLRNHGFGFVFQQFHLDARASVGQNVALPLTIAGVPLGQRRRIVADILTRLGLGDRVGSRVSELSGGQRQRVAIARAVVNRPSVIFADEPTGALDSENGAAVSDLLFELNRREGMTLVMVTHSRELAERCERTVTLSDGLIIEESKTAEGGTK